MYTLQSYFKLIIIYQWLKSEVYCQILNHILYKICCKIW